MAVSGDQWMQDYHEAAKLAKDIAEMTSKRSSLHTTGPDAEHYLFALKRKILVFGTRLDSLEFHLSSTGQQCLTEEDMNCRKDMVADLRSKKYQMPYTSNVSSSANRNSLLVEKIEPADAMTRATGLDNFGVLDLQRQIIRAQDEELEKLMETISSTTFVAQAIKQEFRLHERLLTLDENKYVEVPDSRLQGAERRLAILHKRTRCGCSCLWLLLLSVTGIIVLAAVIYMLIKFL